MVSPRVTTTAIGAALTSISAARSRRQFSTMRARSATSRSTPPAGSRHFSPAALTYCPASPPGQCRARSTSASSSRRRITSMARDSSFAETLKQGHRARAQWRENLCADRNDDRAKPRRLFSPPTTCGTKLSPRPPPRMRSKVMIPVNASRSRRTSRSFLLSGFCSSKPDDHVILPDVISKEPLGSRGAAGRCAMVQYRQMGAIRHGQCRRTRRDVEKYR